jgi:hypothetical protein
MIAKTSIEISQTTPIKINVFSLALRLINFDLEKEK